MSKTNANKTKKVVVKTTTTKGKTTTNKTNEKLVLDDKFIKAVATAVKLVLQEQTKQAAKVKPSKETKKTNQKKKASAKKPLINSTKTLVNKVYKAVKGSDKRQIKAIIGYLNKLRTKAKIKDYLTWLGKSKEIGRKCDIKVAKAILEFSKIEIK